MTVSELITALTEFQNKHGDLICVFGDGLEIRTVSQIRYVYFMTWDGDEFHETLPGCRIT